MKKYFHKFLVVAVFAIAFFAFDAKSASAAPVYFSVGQNTTDHKVTSNVTISGTTATFTVAQTATNMGVGDVIDYDTDHKLCYISGKTSGTVWSCTNATGGAPTAATGVVVNSISHVFSSLSAALPSGAGGAKTLVGNSNLTTIDAQLNIPCYYDSDADTTEVLIENWTTDATRYIKVYTPNNTSTETNVSQRHAGKWDAAKYNLAVISTVQSLRVRNVPYTVVDGLQIEAKGQGNYSSNGINISGTSNFVTIKNNIVRSTIPLTVPNQDPAGIFLGTIEIYVAYIYNNIVYDFKINRGTGMGIYVSYASVYAYNNTVHNSDRGFYTDSSVNVVAKNNIAQNCTDGYLGTFHANSSNNISDLANDIQQGTNNKNSTIVSFVDATNKDFHLFPTDTAAKNAGADLHADANLPFSVDIDGNARPNGMWDIGADQQTRQIYRSVGPGNTSALATGTSNALGISGVTATFSSGLPNNVGVGDVIQYDSDNNSTIDALAFIEARTDSTHYTVQNVAGANPTATSANDNDWLIFRAYTSLFNAEVGTENTGIAAGLQNFDTWSNGRDLVAANQQWSIACYGDAPDTTSVQVYGWTTDAIRFMKIYTPQFSNEVGILQRHSGVWDANKYNLVTGTGNYTIQVAPAFTVVDGLQINNTGTANGDVGLNLYTYSGNFTVKNNIVKNGNIGIFYAPVAGTLRDKNFIYNNIVYGSYRTGIYVDSVGLPNYIYNNTATRCNLSNGDYLYGIDGNNANNFLSNNISINNGGYGVYKGDFGSDGTQSYNISQDNSATGTGSLTGRTATASTSPGAGNWVMFKNITSGSEDFHLQFNPENDAIDRGLDLSTTFATDIDGQIRSVIANPWDIGADEQGDARPVYYSVGQSAADLKTGTPSVTITAGAAVFSVAQTGNIGVGDRVTYNTNQIAYISARAHSDSAHWSLVTATGGLPADISNSTVVSITREFTSLSAAVVAAGNATHINNTDLVAANVVLNLPCYYDSGADTTAVTVDGYTTGVSNFIKIYTPNSTSTEANNSQRHAGKWDDGKFNMIGGGWSFAISNNEEYTRIEGLQITVESTTGGGNGGIEWNLSYGEGAYVSNNIVRMTGTPTGGNYSGIVVESYVSGSHKVWNNIVYGFRYNNESIALKIRSGSGYLYNNTVIDSDIGIRAMYNGTYDVKNNISQNCGDGFSDFEGAVFSASSSNNISDLASDAPGANSKNSTTVQFTDAVNKDFHLAPNDTAAKNAGADLFADVNLPFNIDIDGQARSKFQQSGVDDFSTNPSSRWTNLAGSMTWTGGHYEATSGTQDFAVYNAQATSLTQYAKVNVVASNGVGSVVMRSTGNGSDGYYAIATSQADGNAWITYANQSGWVEDLVSAPFSFSSGDNVGVTIEGSGTGTIVRLWRNPVGNVPLSVGNWDSASDSPDTTLSLIGYSGSNFANTGSYTGIGYWENSQFDNFYTGSINAAWDIGADEAATAIFYSVGQNTTSHEIGSGTVTVDATARTATFSVAQTATNMGVGDLITYTGGSCYISSKTSTTVWGCQSVTGGNPTAATNADVTSIAHAFASLDEAEYYASHPTYLNTADLVANNYQLNFPCYYDSGADTVAVTVNDYTTGPNNFIRIYTPNNTSTEVNASQRHSGKWSMDKYRLEAGAVTLYLGDPYTKVDGLQINMNTAATGETVSIHADQISIANSIIRNRPSANNYTNSAILTNEITGYTNYIYNNIIYDGSYGLQDYYGDGISYVYNNTVYNFDLAGFNTQGSTFVVKNNISSENTVDYEALYAGNFDASSANNISQDATSPNSGATDCGGHSCRNQTVQFVDTANKDFHLSPIDTAAKNAGTSLAADSAFAFAIDIDGQTRPSNSSTTWDIGADEAATAIYYSVGQNTTSHETGSGTVTVDATARTATFSVAQTATNMGVGDLVTYAGGSCYITSKTSTSVWGCQSATGGAPTAATNADVTSIAHAFNSLNAAEAGAPALLGTSDLVTGNYQLNIPCYYDSGADTTAVTVDGYTTGASNYIKIYTPNNILTEVNQSQRHSGKWDDGKYAIAIADSNNFGIRLATNFARIEGVQISKTNSAFSSGGAIAFDIFGDIRISNNILKGISTGIYSPSAINSAPSGAQNIGNVSIWNNLLQDFKPQSGAGGQTAVVFNFWSGSTGRVNVYNNTIVNCNKGFDIGVGLAVAINNLFSGCTNDFHASQVYAAGSDYNVTTNASLGYTVSGGGNTHDKTSQNVSFVDVANKDFHLFPSDTAAKNAGADLSADANLSITTDIDGQRRDAPAGRLYDVGADQAANNVFYSVGQSAADLKTGTPTVTIASGTATFSTAQTGNIGVGDRVTYNTNVIAYIASKIDQSNWKVITATGGLPANISNSTVVSIKHEYTNLSTAVTGASDANHINNTDLVAANVVLNIPCYYDSGADTTAVTVDGYTTGVSNFIRIYTPNNITTEANQSQRHSGKWDDGKYRLETSNNNGISLGIGSVKIEGLQVKTTTSLDDRSAINTSSAPSGVIDINSNILQGSLSGGAQYCYGIKVNASGAINKVQNNIIYNWRDILSPSVDNGGISIRYGTGLYAYNNTVYNSIMGYVTSDSANKFTSINNIAQNCSDGFLTNGGATFTAASNYNISDLASDAPGANSKNGVSVKFADAANNDFHLAADDTTAKGAGVNLFADANLSVTTDIDGNSRPAQGGFDIGADQTPTKIFYSVGQNTLDHSIGNAGATCSTTGACTISISNGTATFSHAQTAANLGVGDKVTYNTNSVAYISEKITQTDWKLITATGGTPANVTTQTLNSITHAFASLSLAEAGAPALLGTSDLVAANVQLNFPCYYDTGADTTAVTVDGYTTNAGSYIKIYTPNNIASEVNVSQRHGGKWDAEKYSLDFTADFDYYTGLIISESFTEISGLQVQLNDTNYASVITVQTGWETTGVKMNGLILRGNVTGSGSTRGVVFLEGTSFLSNSLVYDFFGSSNDNQCVNASPQNGISYIYNVSIINCDIGFSGGYTNWVGKNIITQNCSNGFETDTPGVGTDYNISDLASDAPGANSKNSTIVNFVDAANFDFHLSNTDTAARDTGTDLSNDANSPINDDIDGQLRPQGGVFDIGADEAGTTTKINGGVRINGGVKIEKY